MSTNETQPPSRQQELNRMLRAAALTIDERGSLSALAKAVDTHPEVLRRSIRQGYLSAGLAARLEIKFGADLLNHEDLIRKGD